MILATPLALVPIFGNFIYFCVISLLYSFYCFSYTGNCSHSKLGICWIYFLGFGFTLSFITWFGPIYVSLALYAVLFPVFFITAHFSRPKSQSQENHLLPLRVDIFHEAGFVVTRILKFVYAHSFQLASVLKVLFGSNGNGNGGTNSSSANNGKSSGNPNGGTNGSSANGKSNGSTGNSESISKSTIGINSMVSVSATGSGGNNGNVATTNSLTKRRTET